MPTDTPSNVIPFPVEEIADDAPAQDHDVFPPMVVLPYQDPVQRALGTMDKQAVIAFVTVALIGAGDIVARITVGELLDSRMIVLAGLALLIHAALVAVQKYTSAKASDRAGS